MSNLLRELGTLMGAISYIAIVLTLFVLVDRLLRKIGKSKLLMHRGVRTTRSQKDRAIYHHLKNLGPELRKRYGTKPAYTHEQVRETLNYIRYRDGKDCYALAIYCDYLDFNEYHRTIGETCDYHSMRDEIVRSFDAVFHGNTEFTASEAIEYGCNLNDSIEYSSSDGGNAFELFSSHDFSSSSDSYSSSGDSVDAGGGGDFGGSGFD
jgi:uncharacterized membrane protein YgcG